MISFFKKIYKRIFPDHVYYQVYVVKSDPFGEELTPFEFRIDQIRNKEEELPRLAKAAREQAYGKSGGFYTSVTIEKVFTTVRSQKDVVPYVEEHYEMGRYSCTREAHPTISVNITD